MESIEDLLFEIQKEVDRGRKSKFAGGKSTVNSLVINELVERIRNSIPDVVRDARYIVQNAAKMQKEEEIKAQKIIESAQNTAENIVSDHEIIKAAQREADIIKREALEFRAKVLQEIGLDIDSMLTSVGKTLLDNIQIIEKAQKANLDRLNNKF